MANPTRPRRGATRIRQLRRNNCIPAVHTRDKDIGSTIVGHRRSVCTIGCQEGRGPQEYRPSNLRARAPGHARRRRPGRERRPAATIGPSVAKKHSELARKRGKPLLNLRGLACLSTCLSCQGPNVRHTLCCVLRVSAHNRHTNNNN